MAISVSWGNPEKTYTCFKFEGQWTWEEYHQSVREAYAMVKDLPYTVNVLIDMTDCKLFPQNMLSHFGSSMQRVPRTFDLCVVVSSSMFVETLTGMINALFGKKKVRFVSVRTLEAGQRIFAEHDAKQTVKAGGASSRS